MAPSEGNMSVLTGAAGISRRAFRKSPYGVVRRAFFGGRRQHLSTHEVGVARGTSTHWGKDRAVAWTG
ncbi:hypothetical protein DPEC_G00198340 [Dallia pectoralis]|uniref:Uncharacterized protein n=1 Tax=Dallia pectoralis TaxID=75939 RepID=A0ACC2G8A9_DALPE|nr:hypothetical protein DPEC_G00198340 [Dallia pectoralis]